MALNETPISAQPETPAKISLFNRFTAITQKFNTKIKALNLKEKSKILVQKAKQGYNKISDIIIDKTTPASMKHEDTVPQAPVIETATPTQVQPTASVPAENAPQATTTSVTPTATVDNIVPFPTQSAAPAQAIIEEKKAA